MPDDGRNHIDDLRGATQLAAEATKGVTDLVEAVHRRVTAGPLPGLLGNPLAGVINAFAGPVFEQVRGVTALVGAGLDLALAPLASLLASSEPGPQREAVLAALNGVLGDYLARTGNPLAIQLRLRRAGRALPTGAPDLAPAVAAQGANASLLVFVHGSSMCDLQWVKDGRDHPSALAATLGHTPLFLHYNSGLHVSENGHAFSALLEQTVAGWPAPVERLLLVGHSMGGLVARSAVHAASLAGHRWPALLRALVTLGTPHHGAPLERAGNWVDTLLDISSYSAPFARLGQIRSAGVTDLRYGNVRDEDWQGKDRFERAADARVPLPLPEGVRCFAVAASTAQQEAERQPGDGLVPVDSALGRHQSPERTLAFPPAQQRTLLGMNHLGLLWDERVYALLAQWLPEAADTLRPPALR